MLNTESEIKSINRILGRKMQERVACFVGHRYGHTCIRNNKHKHVSSIISTFIEQFESYAFSALCVKKIFLKIKKKIKKKILAPIHTSIVNIPSKYLHLTHQKGIINVQMQGGKLTCQLSN